MKENFNEALKAILKHEGGFTADLRDPGNKLPDGRAGSTMLGVTQANWEAHIGKKVTHEQMKALTPEIVGPFYKKKYWDAVKADDLPDGLDYLMFDFAINAGPGRAIKTMQKAIGTTPDGAIGPKTMQSLKDANQSELVAKFSAEKEAFYRSLPTFATFGKGWLRRVAEAKTHAESMLA